MNNEFLQSAIADFPESAVKNWRLAQVEKLLQLGFPNRKTESWKYTDISPIVNAGLTFPANTLDGDDDIELDIDLPDVSRLVFVNGIFSKALSDTLDISGLIITPITQMLDQESFDEKLTVQKQSAFDLMNAALVEQGFVISVAPNAVIEKPLHIFYLQADATDQPLQTVRLIVDAGVNSQVTLFEEYVSACEGVYFNNVCTQINANVGAQVNHYRLQQEGADAFHVARIQVDQKKDAVVNTYHFNLGGKIARQDLHYRFLEPGGCAKIVGLYAGGDKQHLDSQTQVDHLATDCMSDQVHHGVMNDQAHAVFNGKIYVKKDAQKTQAYLNNHNLLLAEKAQIDTKPELEIYADDVKCSHGATVGCIDPDTLFYLRSRGIDKMSAEKLLVDAFLAELVLMLPNPAIQSYIQSVVGHGV